MSEYVQVIGEERKKKYKEIYRLEKGDRTYNQERGW